jgi:hypothetical protein
MDQHLDPAAFLRPRAVDGANAALDPELELDRALITDAAGVLSARQQLEFLLAELTARPFSPKAYRGLPAYRSGPADRAQAAHQRVCASKTGRSA